MWSLCFVILIEFSLGFFSRLYICSLLQWGRVSGGRNRAFLVESWVSPGGRPIRHWSLRRRWLPLPWDQWQGPEVGRVMPQLVTGLNKELYWIYSLSYQIKESSFSQKRYYVSLSDRLKEGPQWANCVVLITTLLQHCTFHEYVFNRQSLATMLASSRWSSGQDMGFCGLSMANSELGYHNLLSSGQMPKSLGWSKCWLQEIQISTMYRYIPLNLDLPLNVRIYQWLQICKVNSRQWVYVMVKGLLC